MTTAAVVVPGDQQGNPQPTSSVPPGSDSVASEMLAAERARVKALKDSLDRAYSERDNLRKEMDGVDISKAREALKFVAEYEEKKAIEKGEFDKLRAQLVADHQKELAARDQTAERYRSALERHLLRGEALRALAEAGVDNPDLLLPHVLAAAAVVEDGGEYEVRVREGSNGRGYRYGKSGQPLTLKELVDQDLRERFPQAFPARIGSGSDAPGSRHGGAVDGKQRMSRSQFGAMGPKEQMGFITAGGVLVEG